eukprot:NODE_1554_length_829_cov_155.142308_g1294_i0.p1 GENE.NODE_1554_length_829_cov_155.142308_g1294_i0~~NODE_1554_length_829_cov_155.142308_g1294_i0.p1  ORF type:complete len:226 (-),score=16.60 NODE_1554_length_829_cov_155.142308_g1294_i0:101-778(-)
MMVDGEEPVPSEEAPAVQDEPVLLPENVQIDALPYIDPPLTDKESAYVNFLVEEEMKTFKPVDYLARLPKPPINLSELLQAEMKRVESGVPLRALDETRFDIPEPRGADRADIARWRECMDNACAQLENQSLRFMNLELISDYGKQVWLDYNSYLLKCQAPFRTQLDSAKRTMEQINIQRKSDQLKQLQSLQNMRQQWESLAERNLDIQIETDRIERECKRLRRF